MSYQMADSVGFEPTQPFYRLYRLAGGYITTLSTVRLERVTRIELAYSAWKADVLPLNYTRLVH